MAFGRNADKSGSTSGGSSSGRGGQKRGGKAGSADPNLRQDDRASSASRAGGTPPFSARQR